MFIHVACSQADIILEGLTFLPLLPFSPFRKQEERVQQVRKKLEEALMADILSRAADTTKDIEVEMDNGDEA